MSKNTFCTIITKSHLSWALALNDSVKQFDENIKMYILVTDVHYLESNYLIKFPNTNILYLKDIENIKYGKEIIEKYAEQPDFMRWALKPTLISYLITQKFEKIIYCDCDIYFYDGYNFLWEELDKNNVLLTPHWISHQNLINIGSIHSAGLFNAGFIGVSKPGYDVMDWWAKACLYKCVHSVDYLNGDQGYLDLFPVYFDNIKILTHKGCNVAYWNSDYLKRLIENGNFSLEFEKHKYPLIFYHFGRNSYSQFLKSSEEAFIGILEILNSTLKKYGFTKDLLELAQKQLEQQNCEINKPLNRVRSFFGKKIRYRIYKMNND